MWAALITSKIRLTSEVTSAQDPYRCLWEMQLFLLFLCYFLVSGLFFSYCSTFSFVPFSTPSLPPAFSKTIKVKIIDDEEYEKNKTFYVELGEPRLVEGSDNKVQEEGEHLWMLNPPECPPHCRGCMFSTTTHRRRLFSGKIVFELPLLSSWCVPTANMQQAVGHLISLHPWLHLLCVCVCVSVLACASSVLSLSCFSFIMHAFTTSLCVCVCVLSHTGRP